EAERVGTPAQVLDGALPVAFLVVVRARVDVCHPVAQRVVEQHGDLARRGRYCLRLAHAHREATEEGAQRGVRLADSGRGEPQENSRSVAGPSRARAEHLAAGDLAT